MSQLAIDWTRCDGHGLCARMLPEAIELDEWGFPVLKPIPPGAEASARRVVHICPRLALRLEADPSA